MRFSAEFLDKKLWSRVRNPIWYVGGELNLPRKEYENSRVRVVFSFPDLYEVGMSNHGWQILYHIVNAQPGFSAERVFAVPPEVEFLMKNENIPLYSLESYTPIDEFDVVAFSLSHELLFTTILQILELGRIPLKASERKNFPLIIAGGPGAANPEPIAPFVDAVFIGDGEEAVVEILEVVRRAKESALNKKALLHELSKIQGIYIPSFLEPVYEKGRLVDFNIVEKDASFPVKKRLVKDIRRVFYPVRQIVPLTQIIHDRFTVEIARGCVRSCRFCQAGMIYRPVRERDIDEILSMVKRGVKETGVGDISFLSLSVGDYTRINELVSKTMEWAVKENISLSFPSVRLDTLNREIIDEIRKVRKTGFTIAPETGNDRLRRIINKYWTNEDVVNTARIVAEAGWRLIKLYFMVGLPEETAEDREAIAELVREVKKIIKNVNTSVALFVPKPHTPFQWEPFAGIKRGYEYLEKIKVRVRRSGARFKWHLPELSWLETVLGRGDRRVGDVILNAYKKGARLDSWSEFFNYEIWEESFKEAGVDPEIFTGEINEDSILPWDMVDYGILKKFLVVDRKRARTGLETPFCLVDRCTACGVCDFKEVKNITSSPPSVGEEKKVVEVSSSDYRKVLIRHRRSGIYKYVSSRDLTRNWGIFFRKAGINVKYSKGYHPLPSISFIFPAPVGVEADEEYLIGEVEKNLTPDELKLKLEAVLPKEFYPLYVQEYSGRIKVAGFLYRAVKRDNCDIVKSMEEFKERDDILWRKENRRGNYKVKNIKDYVKVINYTSDELIFEIDLREDGMVPVSVFLEKALHLKDPFSCLTIKREEILFDEEVVRVEENSR